MYRSRGIDSYDDLNLRLGLSPKRVHAFGSTFYGGYPELITIEDDGDDDSVEEEMHVFTERRAPTIRFYTRYSSWTSVLPDDDLELRLGPKDPSEFRSGGLSLLYDSEDPPEFGSGGLSLFYDTKMPGEASSSQAGVEGSQPKFRCSICMDTMKEETSTVCGHVFCKTCIVDALKIQNRCPTCREWLTQSSIHRIYLPGTT